MSTKIEWTHATINPVPGCSPISTGCVRCYARRRAARLAGMKSMKGRYGPVAAWDGTTVLVESELAKPLRWTRPRMIFVNSMGDLFHESVPFAWIAKVFYAMAICYWHTFQVLTKRPERMREFFEWIERRKCGMWWGTFGVGDAGVFIKWPLPNVWLGVTVEAPEYLHRVVSLLDCPAAVRFVSAEPLLAGLDFTRIDIPTSGPGSNTPCAPPSWRRIDSLGGFEGTVDHKGHCVGNGGARRLDWVIVGCETGAGARINERTAALEQQIVHQCARAHVACFVKKWPVLTGGGRWTWSREKDILPAWAVRQYPKGVKSV